MLYTSFRRRRHLPDRVGLLRIQAVPETSFAVFSFQIEIDLTLIRVYTT